MKHNPHAIVEINGQRWDSSEHAQLFKSVRVELATGEASMATWVFRDERFHVSDQYKTIASASSRLPVIRVWLGYGDDLGEPVFKGLLARVEHSKTDATFRCYDMSYRMKLVERAQYHKGGDLDIIKKLVERNELKFQGPTKPLKLEPHKAMTQDGQTDWQHAAEIAHDAGLLLWTRQDTVFADYPAQLKQKPDLTLTYRKDFVIVGDVSLAFKVPENRHGRPKGIEVRGRNRGGKRLTGKSDESQRGREVLRIKRDLAMHTEQRATARAQAQKELDREHAFDVAINQLFAEAPATRPDVRNTIRLLEVGKIFSGDYIANKVTHEFTPGHLITSYELYSDVAE